MAFPGSSDKRAAIICDAVDFQIESDMIRLIVVLDIVSF